MERSGDAAAAAQLIDRSPLPVARALLSVDARSDTTRDGALTVSVGYVNTGIRPIYVFDRLWTLSSSSELLEDPAQTYVFVAGDLLQVLLGLAPLPRRKTVLYRNVPYATKLEPGVAISRRLTLTPPVREYSPYFPAGKRARFETVQTSGIVVLVDYVGELPGLQTIPAPFDANALKLNRAGVHSLAQRAVSPKLPLAFSVLKRADEFDGIGENSTAQ